MEMAINTYIYIGKKLNKAKAGKSSISSLASPRSYSGYMSIN